MYLDFLVKIPDVKGKITFKKKGDAAYVNYEYAREYDKDRKFNIPKRVIIGKVVKSDPTMMQPNQNYLTQFPDAELPEEKYDSPRSSCVRIGTHVVIDKILREYGIPELLERQFDPKDAGLFLDLAAYSLVCEHNAAQNYPDYAFNHPLFTENMHIYSDTKISDFLGNMMRDQSIGFLDDWNERRDHREKIYVSYDSTNKNCQAGDIEIVEFGHPKVDLGVPIFNYSIAYDTQNAIPLFYEAYPGSITDISQLECTIRKAQGYGYRNIGFILDRGYFSKDNIRLMDECGYEFVLMVKGMNSLVDELILDHRGTFEDSRKYSIRSHSVYGMTVKRRLYADDEKERYFHIYHSTGKEHGEREDLEIKLERLGELLKKQYGKPYKPGAGVLKYYDTFTDKSGIFTAAREKDDVIQRELRLCGYFVLVTSEKMTAEKALDLYYQRDASEKLFRGDKTYLGNRSMRTHSTESTEAKIFVEFIALIVRNGIYTKLKAEKEKQEGSPNYMTVPAAMRELDKIEMVRGFDRIYRLDHAITKTQKAILNAFGIDTNYIKSRANRIGEQLRYADEGRRR